MEAVHALNGMRRYSHIQGKINLKRFSKKSEVWNFLSSSLRNFINIYIYKYFTYK